MIKFVVASLLSTFLDSLLVHRSEFSIAEPYSYCVYDQSSIEVTETVSTSSLISSW